MRARSGGLPQVAILETTYRCNHRCVFCYCPWEHNAALVAEECGTAEWKRILSALRGRGVRQVTLSGGEPLLKEDLPELMAYAADLGLSVGLITNGLAMTDALLRSIRLLGVHLSVSVPGIKTYAALTGADRIDETLALIERASSLGIAVTANVTVTRTNLPELYENLALPLLAGAEYILLNRFMPGGRGMEHAELQLTRAELNEAFLVAEDVLHRAGMHGHVGTEVPLCMIDDPERYERLQISTRCGAAKNFFVIDPSGYIKTCNHSPRRVCHWTDLDALPSDAYWRMFSDRSYLPTMCAACSHTDVCEGGCREAAHAVYGDPRADDPCFAAGEQPAHLWRCAFDKLLPKAKTWETPKPGI